MFDIVIAFAGILVTTLAVAQGIGASMLRRKLLGNDSRAETSEVVSTSTPPKTAILLSLRGADPELALGIEALAKQDHPNYRIVIVVDSENDAAWDVIAPVVSRFGPERLSVQTLRSPGTRCGLKCSALVQAYRSLESDVEVIALVDADIVVNPTWLRTLIAPLRDPQVAVTTGAQWFEPATRDSGTWMRSIWNAGASVPTILLGHPWAGSCAVRRSDIDAWGLVEAWERSIIDDGPLAVAASKSGREIRFVPDAWMINREDCSRRFVGTYLRRMLTWSRLYEPTYPLTVAHAVGTVVCWLLCWVGLWSGLVNGLAYRQWLGEIPALLFWASAVFGYFQVHAVAAKVAERRGERLATRGLRDWLRVIWLVPATYLVYAWASVAALFVRRISWRGVEYRLEPDGVRMTHYEPYVAAGTSRQVSVCTPRVHIATTQLRTPRWALTSLMILAIFQGWVLSQTRWYPRYAPAIRPNPLAENRDDKEQEAEVQSQHTSVNLTSQGDGDHASLPGTLDPPTSSGTVTTDPEVIDQSLARWDQLIRKTSDITGVLLKQERIEGRLEPLTRIEFRQLSKPLCVYLKWTDVAAGREVLFRSEDGNETMVARQETVLGALVPNFSLTKDHPFTRTVSRHPVDEMSLEFLRLQLRRYVAQAKRNPEAVMELEFDTLVGDRRVHRLSIMHPRRSELAPGGYHRADMYFDAKTDFPVRWEKYHWPDWKGDERFDPERPADVAPLLEYFELVEFQTDLGLSIQSFATENPEFGFGKSSVVPLP